MSTGSAAIPLLKAAPERDQISNRLEGGPWQGLELCLLPGHVADDDAVDRAIEIARESLDGLTVTAEAPVSWPSGAFVRVDRLDDEARAGIERSARFAAGVGSPVLTIHLFTPVTTDELRAGFAPDEAEIERFMRFYADTCLAAGVTPLIENVPPVLRMRVGGVFFSPVGGHWRDLLDWRERVPELGFTLDVSHAALFRSFAAAYPSPFALPSDRDLDLERFVEELGPATEVAHVSNARGLLGEGLPYEDGEVDLDPLVHRIGELVPLIVAEINEPDHLRSEQMKAGYRRVEQALAGDARPARPRRRLPDDDFDWQDVVGSRDPVPALLELEERLAGRSLLVTGGAGSIGGRLGSLLSGFRPSRITLLDTHEASLAADRRARAGSAVEFSHALCDIRDRGRLEAELERTRPDVVYHLAAYKHVDWAESFPEEFADTNLHGTWNVLEAAKAAGVETVVVASTDKAATAASVYGRTKRLMEELAALAGRSPSMDCVALRLVNVLGSAGSASDLFLRQSRAGVPLTITDTGMLRYWITMAHATTLAAHATLLGGEGESLVTAADPAELAVGELATRIWAAARGEGEPEIDLLGVREGETQREVLIGSGEALGGERLPGIAAISPGEADTRVAEWVAERLPERAGRKEARATWLEAMGRADLFASVDQQPAG